MEEIMPEETQNTPNTEPRFAMRGHYIKDLSFESPHAPASFLSMNEAPKVEMNIGLGAERLGEDMYELAMTLAVRVIGERTLFLVDLVYGGLFAIANVPEDKMEGVLMVDAAFLLFPFARRVVADVTQDGGFPPLLLEPVDFVRLFRENVQKRAAG
jgi:preprotein translocase subunit SecB